jgi:hypothetical protein
MQCISSIWDELGRGEYRGHIKVRLCYEFITNEEILRRNRKSCPVT